MLLLLIAYAIGAIWLVYALGAIWLVYAIPAVVLLALSRFVNALPDWRWLRTPAPKPAPLYVLAHRADLYAVPALLGIALLAIWLLSLAPA